MKPQVAPSDGGCSLGHRVGLAAARARADGHVIHHITLTTAAVEEIGGVPPSYVHGPRAKSNVVWAKSRDHRMIPYKVEG